MPPVRPAIALCVALACASAASSALAESTLTAQHVRRPAIHRANPAVPATPAQQPPDEAAGPLSWLTRLFPDVRPYPPGEGDADGLSRNIEDCNKGCIDNPIR